MLAFVSICRQITFALGVRMQWYSAYLLCLSIYFFNRSLNTEVTKELAVLSVVLKCIEPPSCDLTNDLYNKFLGRQADISRQDLLALLVK